MSFKKSRKKPLRPEDYAEGKLLDKVLMAFLQILVGIVSAPGWVLKGIITHNGAHPDERIGIYLLRTCGAKVFRGMSTETPIQYYDTGRFTPDGRSVMDWIREGWIPVGLWYSFLDEHGLAEQLRACMAQGLLSKDLVPAGTDIYELGLKLRKRECATTLIANVLGMRGDENYGEIIKYALKNDRDAGAKGFDFATQLEEMFSAGLAEDAIQNFADTILGVKLRSQLIFMSAVDEVHAIKPTFVHIQGKNNIAYHRVTMVSNNIYTHRALNLSREVICPDCPPRKVEDGEEVRLRPDVIIVKKMISSHKVIFGRRGLDMDSVAEGWRLRQAVLNGVDPRSLSTSELRSDGTLEKIPQVHYQQEAARLLNGGNRNDNTPGSEVPLRDLEGLCDTMLRNKSHVAKHIAEEQRQRDIEVRDTLLAATEQSASA